MSVADFFERPPVSAGDFDSAGYSRWSALYRRAQAAGIASEVTRITRAIIDLRGILKDDSTRSCEPKRN